MAQIQPARGGARWVQSIVGPGLGTPPIVQLLVASAYAPAAGVGTMSGDFLHMLADGTARVAAVNEPISHVMVSAKNYLGSDSLPRKGNYVPTGTAYTGNTLVTNRLASVILAIPASGQRFELDVPTGAATAAAAQALIGKCCDIVVNAGNAQSGLSGQTAIAVASFETTTTSGQLKLVSIPAYDLQGKANDPTVAYWKGIFEVYELQTII